MSNVDPGFQPTYRPPEGAVADFYNQEPTSQAGGSGEGVHTGELGADGYTSADGLKKMGVVGAPETIDAVAAYEEPVYAPEQGSATEAFYRQPASQVDGSQTGAFPEHATPNTEVVPAVADPTVIAPTGLRQFLKSATGRIRKFGRKSS